MHTHSLRKRKIVEAEVPKKVVKRGKKQVSGDLLILSLSHLDGYLLTCTSSQVIEEAQPLNYFAMLPLELFRDILQQLPNADYIAMKFVCRSFHASTFYEDGREIVDIKARARAEVAEHMGLHQPVAHPTIHSRWFARLRSQAAASRLRSHRLEYQYVLASLEASHPGTLLLLTCVVCGRRKAHGQFGFCDEQFDQTLTHRRCLNSRPAKDYEYRRRLCEVRINGITVTRCGSCRNICPVPKRATSTAAKIPVHQCGIDLGLLA